MADSRSETDAEVVLVQGASPSGQSESVGRIPKASNIQSVETLQAIHRAEK